jgi:hypothetical protein
MTQDIQEESFEPIPMNEHVEYSDLDHFLFDSILGNQSQDQDTALHPGRSEDGSDYLDAMDSGSETDEHSKSDEDSSDHVTSDLILKSEVRACDVLLGRGKSNQKHPGNKIYNGKESRWINIIQGCIAPFTNSMFNIVFSNH